MNELSHVDWINGLREKYDSLDAVHHYVYSSFSRDGWNMALQQVLSHISNHKAVELDVDPFTDGYLHALTDLSLFIKKELIAP